MGSGSGSGRREGEGEGEALTQAHRLLDVFGDVVRVRNERDIYAALELQRPVAEDGLQNPALMRLHRLHLVEGVLPHVLLHEKPLAHPDDPVIRHDNVRRGFAEEHEEEPMVGDEEECEGRYVRDMGEPRGVIRRNARERKEEQAHR